VNRTPEPDHGAARIDAHAQERLAYAVHLAGGFGVEGAADDMDGGFVRDEDRGTQPTVLLPFVASTGSRRACVGFASFRLRCSAPFEFGKFACGSPIFDSLVTA
jgi:hypothetical protein